jgi:uncharacterized protein (TIGR00661 family)
VAAPKSFVNFNTNQAGKVKTMGKPRILLAPLDWGLGHTTRCIPLIRELLSHEAEVFLAGNGAQLEMLAQEFPDLPMLPLRGYDIRYSSRKRGFVWNIIRQLPKINRATQSENAWLKEMVLEYDFDAVISDNRYGLYHPAIPCIFITHQLAIQSPLGRWNEKILQKWNYKYLNRFRECWIPDMAGSQNLAGDLSHPVNKPIIPARYIGLLSRFERKGAAEKKNHLLIILSGPEPQRSILEDKLINEIVHYSGTADIVRGLPATAMLMPSTNQIQFFNHLPAMELNKKIEEAEFVISRCGYSTVMDLVKLQKKSILIPTPGQTEQEYLSRYLSGRKIAYCISQDEISLETHLQKAKEFDYHFSDTNDNHLKETISGFLLKLKMGLTI